MSKTLFIVNMHNPKAWDACKKVSQAIDENMPYVVLPKDEFKAFLSKDVELVEVQSND